VGWEELTDGVIVAGQPDGAPSWFPCNDHPSDKASYSIAVTTDPGYHVVANGVLTERMVMSSRERWCYEQVEPMSTYLATVQIGRYKVLETAAAPVRQLAAVPERLQALFRHDFGRQHEMMVLFERLFGPYPFASYTVVVADDELEIPLEAQGLSVFGRNHLDGRRGAQRLVAHELAHQWFGNSVTAGRWQDIWLHEGFACYAEWLWSEGSGGSSADVLARRAYERLAGLPQDIAVGDPGPERMFDDRVYKRGALTLHAVRLTVGDGTFFDTLRAWTRTHAHGTAVTDDFVDLATRHSDTPLRELFHAWLCQAPLPKLPELLPAR
jgi:aminopeptidase